MKSSQRKWIFDKLQRCLRRPGNRKGRTVKRPVLLLLVFAVGLLTPLYALTPASAAPGAQADALAYRPGRLLVGIAAGIAPDVAAAELVAQGFFVNKIYPDFGLIDVSAPAAAAAGAEYQAQAAQSALAASAHFTYVALDAQVTIAQVETAVQAASLPNDPLLPQQWAPGVIRAFDAWEIGVGDERTTIAILDTGYDRGHEDLSSARLWVNTAEEAGLPGVDDDANGYVDDVNGWDWVDLDGDPQDLHGHGTHVMGIIAATTNNAVGVTGIGGNLRVAPLRVLDRFGSGYISDLVAALDYARANGMRIANLSLTVAIDSPALGDAVRASAASGMLIAAATGNTRGSVLWPAAYPETLAVAATTSSDTRASFSNAGPAVDLAAPGERILSTYLGSTYREQTGTSMASPHAAALAGLVWSLRPEFSPGQVVETLKATAVDVNVATDPGSDIYLGAGRIDMQAALFRAAQFVSVIPARASAQVAGTPVPFRVELRNAAGDMLSTPALVAIETSLGTIGFEGIPPAVGQVLLVSGVITGQLVPGATAGLATLTAIAGGDSSTAKVQILPGPPAEIIGPDSGISAVAVADSQYDLVFLVHDAYGNAVTDGTAVEFTSFDGTLVPTATTTFAGEATTRLSVNAPAAEAVTVTVSIPSQNLSANLPVTLVRRMYFPRIFVQSHRNFFARILP